MTWPNTLPQTHDQNDVAHLIGQLVNELHHGTLVREILAQAESRQQHGKEQRNGTIADEGQKFVHRAFADKEHADGTGADQNGREQNERNDQTRGGGIGIVGQEGS